MDQQYSIQMNAGIAEIVGLVVLVEPYNMSFLYLCWYNFYIPYCVADKGVEVNGT
jgi:hypothetical protein